MPDDTLTRCFGSPDDSLMMSYHDNEWGIPFHDDRKQFEFLCLESMQSGLSWKTILDKRENFRKAFANFDPVKVAAYTEADIERLMTDAGIIRNRRKIEAIVNNARRFLEVQKEFGSFDAYIWQFTGNKVLRRDYEQVPAQTPESETLSKDLKARGLQIHGPHRRLLPHASHRPSQRPPSYVLPRAELIAPAPTFHISILEMLQSPDWHLNQPTA